MAHTARVGPRPAADRLIWLLSAGLAAIALVLWWLGPPLPELEPHLWWPLLAVLFGVSERFAIHLPFGRDNHSITFSQAPLVLGLLFLDLDSLLLAAFVGITAAQLVGYRHPPIKIAFNTASNVAQVSVGAAVFAGLLSWLGVDPAGLAPAVWAAALAATLAADLVANLALFAIISLRQGHWDTRVFLRTLAIAAVSTLVVTDLALVTAILLVREPEALALLSVVGVLSFLLYRGYHVQRLRYSRLELLYRFTQSVDQALQHGSVEDAVCRGARDLLRARHAELIPCVGAPDVAVEEWYATACSGELVRLPRGGQGPAYDALRRAGHVDAMAVPLREGGEIVAILAVADRLDDVSTFDGHDARLFEALAGHARVALANAELVQRVRDAARDTEHLSLHDPLTSLPNRLHFQQRLERRLSTTGSAAVLLMDLDRFKEVNDTLGHDVGDQLLQEVGRRLRLLERPETVVARLGGDEFAVLLGRRRRARGGHGRADRPRRRPAVRRSAT